MQSSWNGIFANHFLMHSSGQAALELTGSSRTF
ncbi:hypothetical protein H206_05361 [Candidatus Electrothrix aarhusensis]|uniref:Uncharacterized protein n=1 Tax=Candidatus Electrothrix aarhusensis TaxID=1859131 RepID=A0A444J4S5_9BACT|nr:hypothetical protein H206_05361 [Candidatus Electrothrix aarhusensis]